MMFVINYISNLQDLSFYRVKKNTTTDFYGKMLTKGNAAAGLIYDAFQKKKAKR